MQFKYESEWDDLLKNLDKLEKRSPVVGKRIAMDAVKTMDQAARDHLATQGRGGYPPPLSELTRHIYSIDGEPDGSGIHDNMEIAYQTRGSNFVAILGVVKGKATMIAKVQNSGAVIPVTDKMRGFFAARYGIGLRAETTHIIVPGRKFWDESLRQAKSQAIRDLGNFFCEVLK